MIGGTTAALAEMLSGTERNAANAAKADLLAKLAQAVADRGSADMQLMAASIAGINAAGCDIAKITKTIDEIAFQTNILALNAAIETARAGEAVLGFAVVAGEVRKLARRSAEAARETSTRIDAAVAKAANGFGLSGKVSEALADIVARVQQVVQVAAEVAASSAAQTKSIGQLSAAAGVLDQVTRSASAAASETAVAGEQLDGSNPLHSARGRRVIDSGGRPPSTEQRVLYGRSRPPGLRTPPWMKLAP